MTIFIPTTSCECLHLCHASEGDFTGSTTPVTCAPELTLRERNDERVRQQFDALASNPCYWDFRGAKRDAMHGVTQYPAMMVPAMQGKLLDVLCDVVGPNIRMVDPFIGSGTTLVEAMRRGIDFWGQDINPLAVLISLSKTGPFNIPQLEAAIERVREAALGHHVTSAEVDFPNRDKWFCLSVSQELSLLRSAIQSETDLWVRRMLWVSLAETVRLTSNSRTSTFKLHIRSEEELACRKISAIEEFQKLAADSVKRAREEFAVLAEAGFLKDNTYTGITCIDIGRSGLALPGDEPFDLLVTSPPYGDGVTTVPYGQYSYLPLQWIDLKDIGRDLDSSFLNSTHEIDARALGGSRRDALERVKPAEIQSPSLNSYLKAVAEVSRDHISKVAAFFADLTPVLDTICRRMRHGGYMAWTVGNRRVGGISQPFDEILTELLQARGCILVDKLERSIPNKRMATRNSISQTMRREETLILRMVDK